MKSVEELLEVRIKLAGKTTVGLVTYNRKTNKMWWR
jgi:hypothetical protein